MIRKLGSKGLAALFATVSLIAVMASPAAAGTGDASVDSGDFVVEFEVIGQQTISIGDDPEEPPCTLPPQPPAEIEIEFTETDADTAETEITDATFPTTLFEHPSSPGTWFRVDTSLVTELFETPVDLTGDIDGDISRQNLVLAFTLSNSFQPQGGNCPNPAPLCTVGAFLTDEFAFPPLDNAHPLIGTLDGGFDATVPEGGATLETDTDPVLDGWAVAIDECEAPISGWLDGGNGVPFSVSDLHLTVEPA